MSEPSRRLNPNKGPAGSGQTLPGGMVALGGSRLGPPARPTTATTGGLFFDATSSAGNQSTSSIQRKTQLMPTFTPFGAGPVVNQPKKEKPFGAARTGPTAVLPSSTSTERKASGELPEWQKKAAEFNEKQFVSSVKLVISGDKTITELAMQPMICGVIKYIIQNRHKDLDESLVVSLSRLTLVKPDYFRSELVLSALLALAKRDGLTATFVAPKGKSSVVNSILATNLLYAVFQNVPRWPVQLMMLYLDDAANDRQWVDLAECRDFVRAIRFSFGTRCASMTGGVAQTEPVSFLDIEATKKSNAAGQSPRHFFLEDSDRLNRRSPSPSRSSPSVFGADGLLADDSQSDSNLSGMALSVKDSRPNRVDRFEQHQADLPRLLMDAIMSAVKRATDGKNLVRLLITTSGIPSVRLCAMQKIEMWMNNAKTSNAAMTLIATVCANCSGVSEEDVNVISLFLKIRCKSKQNIDHYFACLNDLLARNPENLHTVCRVSIETELTDMAILRRVPWTLTALAAAVKMKPVESATILGNLFATSLIGASGDISHHLRTILHDLSKVYKADIRYDKFVGSMLSSRAFSGFGLSNQLKADDQQTKDRKVLGLLDISLAAEALTMIVRFKEELLADNPDAFLNILTRLRTTKIDYFRKDARKHFSPSQEVVQQYFNKVFYLDRLVFPLSDKWPTESERNLFIRTASRTPVTTNVLWQIRLQMQGCDTTAIVDMLEAVLTRALMSKGGGSDREIFQLADLDITFVEAVMGLGVYVKPANISLPPKYRAPELIRKDHLWQCWKLVILLAAADPQGIGAQIWRQLPTARTIMQMVIINRFEFPPETMLSTEQDARYFLNAELKMAEDDKRAIFDFENRLHGGTSKNLQISEANAVMTKDYVRFDLRAFCRQPPEIFLASLEKMNKSLELGRLFSGCRNPDFLLEMVEHRGTAASLPWLLELTSSSKSMFDVLPVECVCEMLSHSLSKKPVGTAEKREQEFQKCRNLATRLSDSVTFDSADTNNVAKILEFFSSRLSTRTLMERETARTALEIFFDPGKIDVALSRLWGFMPVANGIGTSASAETSTSMQPKSKHGISIEHLLKKQMDTWDPFSSLHNPVKRTSYTEKFRWLLSDIVHSAQFEVLREGLCMQLAKALEIECETECVCAYLDFIANHLFATTPSTGSSIAEYLVMQVIADIIANRTDLRDALFMASNSEESFSVKDRSQVQHAVVLLFEEFLTTAESTDPNSLDPSLIVDGKFMSSDQILLVPGLASTYCLTATVARAYLVLLALMDKPQKYVTAAPRLMSFATNHRALFESVDHFMQAPVVLITPAVREVILKRCLVSSLMEAALLGVSTDTLLDLIFCCDIPPENLRSMVKMVDMKDDNTKALVRFLVTKQSFVIRGAMEMRAADKLLMNDPVHSFIRQVISSKVSPFSAAF